MEILSIKRKTFYKGLLLPDIDSVQLALLAWISNDKSRFAAAKDLFRGNPKQGFQMAILSLAGTDHELTTQTLSSLIRDMEEVLPTGDEFYVNFGYSCSFTPFFQTVIKAQKIDERGYWLKIYTRGDEERSIEKQIQHTLEVNPGLIGEFVDLQLKVSIGSLFDIDFEPITPAINEVFKLELSPVDLARRFYQGRGIWDLHVYPIRDRDGIFIRFVSKNNTIMPPRIPKKVMKAEMAKAGISYKYQSKLPDDVDWVLDGPKVTGGDVIEENPFLMFWAFRHSSIGIHVPFPLELSEQVKKDFDKLSNNLERLVSSAP